jgi:hypothetical protein
VALPVLLLTILVAEDHRRSKIASAGALVAGTVLSLAVLIAPVADGVRYTLAFHADRFGTGLTVQEMLSWWAQSLARFDWQPSLPLYLTVFLGPWTLVLAILVAAWAVVGRLPSLRIGVLVFVLAFLVGSKLVNEPYVVAAVALSTVALAQQPSNGLRGCRTLLWGLAFAYAVLNLPPWAFFTSALQQLAHGTTPAIALWASAYVVARSGLEAIVPFALLGTAFTATAVAAAVIALRESPLPAPGEELA